MNTGQVTAGAVLGRRYELTAAMASGGMAQVWRARDQVLNRPVAIKILHPHLATDEAFVSRFRREAISSARLQHSSIVAVYDTVSENGVEAIVMELIEGRTLRSILDHSGTLPPSTVVQIGMQIADALSVAHQAGTVHRDIKPANIMIDNEMRVVVTDFGIAKANRDADLTDTGTLLGTAKYLAPEQVTGDPVDPRTDLYALGVVMFEALTGEPPFNSETDAATALARLQGPVPRCRDRSPSVPAGLDAIVARAMAQSPEDRFERAVVMRDALINADLSSLHVDDESVGAGGNGRGPEPRPISTLNNPVHSTPNHVPAPTPVVEDGTALMSSDMIRGETGELSTRPSDRVSSDGKRSGRALVGRTLFVLLFIAALAVAGLLAITGGLGGLGLGGGDPLVLTGATSTDPQGDDLEEREDRVDLAIDGDESTRWFTRSYSQPGFSGLKNGVGLAVFLDGEQQIDEITLLSPTEGWSAEFYLITKDIDAWTSEDRDVFDPTAATLLGSVSDRTGDATVNLDNTSGRGVVIWVTEPGTTTGSDGNVRGRLVIREVIVR